MFDAISNVSYGLCAVAYASLSLLIGARRGAVPWRWPVLAACLATGLWAAAVLGWLMGVAPPLLPQLAESVRNACWIFLLLALLGGIDRLGAVGARRLSAQRLLTPLVALAVGLDVVMLAVAPLFADLGWLLIPLGQLVALVIPVLGLLILENLFRNSGPSGRWGLKHACLGLGTIFAFDFILSADALLLSRVTPDFLAARGLVTALTALPVAVSLTRTASWTRKRDIDINASRGGVFFTAALTVCGVYLLAMAAAGFYIREIGGRWGLTLQVVFVVGGLALLAAALGSGTLKSHFTALVQRHFFTVKYDYRNEWLRFVRVLSSTMPLKLSERLARTLAEMIDSPGGALWVRQRGDHAFVLGAAWNYRGVCPSVGRESALIGFLEKTGAIIEIDAERPPSPRGSEAALPDWITDHPQVWLVIPLIFGGEILGFLALDHARRRRRLDWEDRDLLTTTATHAASYLAQELAADALSEAQRFEEFNRRFAFVAHDIKTVVGQMSLMLENSRRFGDNPNFQKDMADTVRNSVARMTALLAQLAEKRRPVEHGAATGLAEVDVSALLAGVAERWSNVRPGGLSLAPSAIALRAVANADALIGALDLLIDNAFAAADPGAAVVLRLSRSGSHAVIEVEDNGPGMDRDFLSAELFRPLRSTKPDGFGIGAYQTRHVIQDMGGRLEVDSAPGRGTTMRILLPLAADAAASVVMAPAPLARVGGLAR